jgi:hypothetical protein
MKRLGKLTLVLGTTLLLTSGTLSFAADQDRLRLRDGSCQTTTAIQDRNRAQDGLRDGSRSIVDQSRTLDRERTRVRSGNARTR